MTPDQRGQGQNEQRATRQRRTDPTHLNMWLTFAGTVLAAVIGGIFALIAAGGDDDPAAPAADNVAPAATTASPPAAQPAPSDASASTGPSSATGVPVRWSGRLVVSAVPSLSDAVDLDREPPRATDDTAAAADLSLGRLDAGEVDVGKAALGLPSAFALWDGSGTPEFAQCQEASLAQGVAKVTAVETGAVICARTNQDRIARLTVRKIDSRQDSVTFDAVVWDND
ncbi:hypothetical protein ACQP2Y_27495 [Actinoplanes sp. CA-051413]|uniref:hypothetical protein n=1 Tax=Actinoplanes sp. CA-051413 TaxID=3239899 RepID=UPI003D999F2E